MSFADFVTFVKCASPANSKRNRYHSVLILGFNMVRKKKKRLILHLSSVLLHIQQCGVFRTPKK